MKVLLKKGMPANIASYTGTAGELVISESASMVYIVDGTTPGGHPVDGITYSVDAPSIVAPIDASTGVDPSPILQCSAFVGSGAHVATYWEVATDSGFTNVIHDSGRDTVNLLQYSLANASVTLDPLTTYYVRAKHESTLTLVSEYSTVVSFETKSNLLFSSLLQQIDTSPSDGNARNNHFDISANGNIIVAGASGYNSGAGMFNIFKRSTGSWSIIKSTIGGAGLALGFNTSISDDGNVIAVSEVGYNASKGQVKIYKSTDNTAYGLSVSLDPGTSVPGAQIGYYLQISGDGKTVVAAGANANDDIYVWKNTTGNTWVKTVIPVADKGRPISVSDDGNTIVISNYIYNTLVNNGGGMRVYEYANSTWSLTYSYNHPVAGGTYGQWCRVSGDGNTIVISRYSAVDANNPNPILIFTRNGGTWDMVGLAPTDSVAGMWYADWVYGQGFDISSDGQTIALQARQNSTYYIYLFKKINGVWEQKQKLLASDYNANTGGSFNGLALNIDATRLVVGVVASQWMVIF